MSNQTAQPYTVLKIATDSGPLAQIWLAANMSNIPRGSILQTSIEDSAKEIAKASGCETSIEQAAESITLRTSGELLQGIVRVYSKQAGFLLSDIKDTLTKITALFKTHSRINVTINRISTIAKVNQLVLEDTVTEREVLSTPSLDFLVEKHTNKKTLLNEHNSILRDVYGARTTEGDQSLEVGRRFNPDGDFEHNSSALALDFDINEGPHDSEMSNEGTREDQAGNNMDTANNMDFPIDEPLDDNDNWDLGINENHDESVEVGRRADEPLLDEPTEFGFNLDLDKEEPITDIVEDDMEPTVQQHKASSNKRRDPSLKNTSTIMIDERSELSKSNFIESTGTKVTDSSSNRNIIRKSLSHKRLLNEVLSDLGYLNNSIVSGLLSYHITKKQKVQETTNDIEEIEMIENSPVIPALNISLEMNDNNSILDMDDVQTELGDYALNDIMSHTLEDPEENSNIEAQGTFLVDSQTTNPGSQILPSADVDNVELVTGNAASRNTVELAETLRSFTDDKNITYSGILNNSVTEGNKPTKHDASQCFFDILTLATSGCIKLDQTSAFEDISISTLKPLYEKYIPA
ncbi:sister chromatid cohesion protein 1 [Maudiozyma exigua]|uniref:Sister chromatid cohesion protein 1 n=1 Tax=Maudiozyma exigua TaxID=34358 RepID=A0A9P7B219_MAUEX|nr:sister chromatid cohesion protein 1 [Kazachstania exigua]